MALTKHVYIFKKFSSIDKIDEIDKNRLILGRKVVSIDFYRLIDTIDINQHDFID